MSNCFSKISSLSLSAKGSRALRNTLRSAAIRHKQNALNRLLQMRSLVIGGMTMEIFMKNEKQLGQNFKKRRKLF